LNKVHGVPASKQWTLTVKLRSADDQRNGTGKCGECRVTKTIARVVHDSGSESFFRNQLQQLKGQESPRRVQSAVRPQSQRISHWRA
jgi:hypothetical protein